MRKETEREREGRGKERGMRNEDDESARERSSGRKEKREEREEREREEEESGQWRCVVRGSRQGRQTATRGVRKKGETGWVLIEKSSLFWSRFCQLAACMHGAMSRPV